ncbi:MAG: precorrin-2 C(20)-methyltransferase [Corynebacterium sp.]|nr:precorrin-2 C(20)-methyltransferase [Corynebacterium sp.]
MDIHATGRLIGVGVGPGDPELITLKAVRAIENADVLVYHSKPGGKSSALSAAEAYINPGCEHLPLEYPVTVGHTDHPGGYEGALADFYAHAHQEISAKLDAGKTVVVISIGDPLLYSSYQHLHSMFEQDYETSIIPGISSVSAAAASSESILADDSESLAIVSATSSPEELSARLAMVDRAVILKVGNHMEELIRVLTNRGRLHSSTLVSYASTGREKVLPLADFAPGTPVPYFSVIIVGKATAASNEYPHGKESHREEAHGWVAVVGLGPGPGVWMSPEAHEVLAQATDIIGYSTYVNRVTLGAGQVAHVTDNREEAERALHAFSLAADGARVAVVSSGDPGVFAMASPIIEEGQNWEVPVRIVPGISAAHAAASRVGAPLGHDFGIINLSDNLKPWSVVENRIKHLVAADMAFAVYNPASKARKEQVKKLLDLVPEDRLVIQARAVGHPEEAILVAPAGQIRPDSIDMRTILIVGATNTHSYTSADTTRVFTSRYYES